AAFPPAGAAKTPYRPAADFHIVTAVETPTTPAALELRRREVLRQASVALAGRTVALWEVSPSAEVVPILASAAAPRPADTRLDLDATLHRWSAPIIQGSRWVGCRLDNGDGVGPWCVAPVRQQPPAPPRSTSWRAWATAWTRRSSSCARFRTGRAARWPAPSGSTRRRWCAPASRSNGPWRASAASRCRAS